MPSLLASKMRWMTGTGRVELPSPVGCVVVDALEDALLDVLEEGTEGLLWRVGGSPSPPMGTGSMLSS